VSLYAEGKTDKSEKNKRNKGNKQYPEEVLSCDCREEKMFKIRFQGYSTTKYTQETTIDNLIEATTARSFHSLKVHPVK